MATAELMNEIEKLLRDEPSKMYSREEILNLLTPKRKNHEVEQLLAELEVTSSLSEGKSCVHSMCRGGTVYYKWNNKSDG